MQIAGVEYLDIYNGDELQEAANKLRDMLMAQHQVPEKFAVAAGGYADEMMAPPSKAWLEWRMMYPSGTQYQMGITLDPYKMSKEALLNTACSMLGESLSRSIAHANGAHTP